VRDDRPDPDDDTFGDEYPPRRARSEGNGTNGARPDGMRTRAIPLDEYRSVHQHVGGTQRSDDTEPVDLVAVQADDELINALAKGMSVSAPGTGGYDADDRVAAVLAAWKAEVDAEAIPELVDVDTAASTIAAAQAPPRRRWHLAPVAAAAAFVVLSVGGLSVGSYSADPGDALWGVSKVLYSERAESVEAAARVQMYIAKAEQALRAGDKAAAMEELAKAEPDLTVVRPEEGKKELSEVQDSLVAQAEEAPPQPPGTQTDPGASSAEGPGQSAAPGSAANRQPPQPQPANPAAPSSPVEGRSPAGRDNPTPPGPTPAPTDTSPTSTEPTPPEPTTEPSPSPAGGGEGIVDPPSGEPSPSATAEGRPDATTTPA